MSQQPVIKPVTDIGEVLRQAREAKGMSIASAAMHTNLRKDILEKLEANQFGEIGAPVFTRGYLNIYARALEVDEELVISEFSSAVQPRREHSLRINSANAESQGKPYRRSMARGWISLIIVLLLAGGLIMQIMDEHSWLMKQIRGTFGQQPETVVEPVAQPDESDPDTPDFTVEVAGSDPARSEIPALTSVEDLPGNTPENENTTSTGLELASLESDGGDRDGNAGMDEERTPADSNTQEQSPPVVSGKAILNTNLENWIEITNANGRVVSSKIHKAGDSIELDADGAPYRLNIGRPNAVTLTVNGEVKPLSDYRNTNQSRLFNLSIPNE